MTKKPSYRFAGHTEPWEEKKLGEVAEIYDGTHQTPIYTTEGVMFLSVENIRTLHSDKYISKDDFNKDFKISPKSGDVLMTRIGDIGTSNLVETDIDLAYYVSLALIRSSVIESKFLNVSISSDYFQKELWKRTLHIAFPKKINKNEIGQSKFFYPSLPEQTAIGSFFQDIDQFTSLQQRKLEVLKEQKKTYLKLLFPAKGQTKPALRFAGFEDDWKEVKLGDFVEISKGIQRNKEFLSPNADSKNCYPVYNGGKQESGYTDEFNREGNIMISEGGASAGFVNYFDGKYWSGGHNFTIDELENDINYVLALLESQQQELYSLQVGSGLPNIQLNSLKKVIITFPAFLEQQAIGSFFQDLDKAIAKQEEKVNQLKESKQTLLRKMFI